MAFVPAPGYQPAYNPVRDPGPWLSSTLTSTHQFTLTLILRGAHPVVVGLIYPVLTLGLD